MGNKNFPYDPDLKEVMEKIKGLLDEYDIGAAIILTSKTHSEILHYFPKWSIIQINRKENEVQICSKRQDFESAQQQHEITEASTAMILAMRDLSEQFFMNSQEIVEALEKHMEIEYTSLSKYHPHFEN